jgi:hypothetical protein
MFNPLFPLAAEAELKQLQELSGGTYLENDLLRHNLVVFRGGEHALQVCVYVCVCVCVCVCMGERGLLTLRDACIKLQPNEFRDTCNSVCTHT